jgi:hypothetical protein
MRRAVVAAVLALPLLLPVGAAAKGGPATVRLCGASGCAKVAEEPQLLVALGGTGPEVRPATVPPAQPFYRVELTDEFDQSWSGFLVPRAHAVLIGGKWLAVPLADAAQLGPTIARVRPFPRPRLSGVVVGGKPAPSPAGYLDAYGRLPRAPFPPQASGWVPIELESPRPSPWTGAGHDVEYLPSGHVLFRDGEWVRAPEALVGRIEGDAGLASDGSSPWRKVAIGIAAAVLAALVALALRRTIVARRRTAIA